MARTPEARMLITAKDATKAAFQSVDNSLGKLTSKVAKVTALFAGIGAGVSFTALIKDTAAYARELQQLETRLGVSTDSLQDLRAIAELAGVGFDAFTNSLQRQARRIAEAQSGLGEAIKALRDLGIAIEDISGLSADEQFLMIADAMEGVTSQGDKMAIAMRLWDVEGVKNLQIINQGTDALREQAEAYRGLSDEAVEAASGLEEIWISTKQALQSITNDLLSKAIPAIYQWVDAWRDAENRQVLAGVEKRIETIIKLQVQLADQMRTVNRFGGNDRALRLQFEALEEELQALQKTAEELERTPGSPTNPQTPARLREVAAATREVAKDTSIMGLALDMVSAEFDKRDRALARTFAGLDKLEKETKKTTEALKEQAEEIPEIYKDAARTINQAFVGVFRDMLDTSEDVFDNFKNAIVDGFKDLIAQLAVLAAKPIVLNIVAGAAGALGVSGSATAGLLGQLGGPAIGGASGLGLLPFLGAGALSFGAGALSGGPGMGAAFGAGIGGIAGLGLMAGTFFPPLWALGLGAGAGGLLGGLGGGLFGGSEPRPTRFQFETAGDSDRFLGRDISGSIATAFGDVGFTEFTDKTGGIALDLLFAVKELDDAVAKLLTAEEILAASEALQETPGMRVETLDFGDRDLANLFRDRLVTIFEEIALPVERLFDGVSSTEDLNRAVTEIFQLDAAITEFLDAVDAETISTGEAALANLTEQIEALSEQASEFGFDQATLDALGDAGKKLAEGLTEDFEQGVADALLQIQDPIEFARIVAQREFDLWAEDLVDSAKALGADMGKVADLIDAKAEQLEDAANDSSINRTTSGELIQTFGDMLRSIPRPDIEGFQEIIEDITDFIRSLQTSDLTTLTPQEQLDFAREAFRSNPSISTAEEFLKEGQEFFSGTRGFQEIFEEVNNTLQGLINENQDAIDQATLDYQARQLAVLQQIAMSNQTIADFFAQQLGINLRQDVAA